MSEELEFANKVVLDDHLKNLVDSIIQNYRQIDVLVNNAGAGTYSAITDLNLIDHLDHVYKLDVRSVVLLTQLCIPHLETTNGAAVNISVLASLKPVFPNNCFLCINKCKSFL